MKTLVSFYKLLSVNSYMKALFFKIIINRMLARLGTSSGDLSMAWVFKPGVAVRQVQAI